MSDDQIISVAASRKPNSVHLRSLGRLRVGELRRDDHSSSPVIADRIKRPTRRPQAGRLWNASLFGLAPCGVLPATCVTTGAVRSYRTFSPLPLRRSRMCEHRKIGCVFSVPLSFELPRPGVTRRTALRSSDFPLRLRSPTWRRRRRRRRSSGSLRRKQLYI